MQINLVSCEFHGKSQVAIYYHKSCLHISSDAPIEAAAAAVVAVRGSTLKWRGRYSLAKSILLSILEINGYEFSAELQTCELLESNQTVREQSVCHLRYSILPGRKRWRARPRLGSCLHRSSRV